MLLVTVIDRFGRRRALIVRRACVAPKSIANGHGHLALRSTGMRSDCGKYRINGVLWPVRSIVVRSIDRLLIKSRRGDLNDRKSPRWDLIIFFKNVNCWKFLKFNWIIVVNEFGSLSRKWNELRRLARKRPGRWSTWSSSHWLRGPLWWNFPI